MTTKEIAHRANSEPRRIDMEPSQTSGMLLQHAEMMDTAYRIADAMCRTSMVPEVYRNKPDDGAAAILYGAELGLNPIQSLRNIFSVHGSPAIYSRTMVALVKKHGYRIVTVESTNNSVTVVGESPDGSVEESTWTIERAELAGYAPVKDSKGQWKKNSNGKLAGNMKYIDIPQEMLYAKAAAEVCRKLAPDVLLGMAFTFEDLEDSVIVDGSTGDVVAGKPKRRRGGRGIEDLKASIGLRTNSHEAEEATAAEAQPEPEPSPEPEPEPKAASDPGEKPEPEQVRDVAATRAQLQKLNILLEKERLGSKTEKLEWLSSQFGRGITSSAQLTKTEATDLIDFLEKAQAEDAAKQEAGQ